MNRCLGSSPSDEARLPGFINLQLPERRQPAASPRRGARTSSAHKKTRSPPGSSSSATATTTSTTATTANNTWQEQKLARHSSSRRTVPRESCLVALCRQIDWQAALDRLEQYPEEAEPRKMEPVEFAGATEVPYPISYSPRGTRRGSTSTGAYSPFSSPSTTFSPSEKQPAIAILYHETALYWLCSWGNFQKENTLLQQLLLALLDANPAQATISCLDRGHTALRALVRNATCTPQALQCLLNGIQSSLPDKEKEDALREVCYQLDRDGLCPLDHIIQRFHQHQFSTSDNSDPLELLQIFVQMVGIDYRNHKHHQGGIPKTPSPLIRLLSLGNTSTNNNATPSKLLTSTAASPLKANSKASNGAARSSRQHPILEATNYFLKHFPFLLYECSLATQCTPLHLALRNYGNDNALLQCFLLGPNSLSSRNGLLEDKDRKCQSVEKEENGANGILTTTGTSATTAIFPKILVSLKHTNQFGDLPLHVACSVGVPVPVLRLVLEGTLQATAYSNIDNLCWTVNNAGYTPVDLEWIRHMEDGKGLFMARSFYPLEASGIRKTWWKQDEFYRVLLQQAVQQAMTSSNTSRRCSSNSGTPKKCPSPQRRIGTAAAPMALVSSSIVTTPVRNLPTQPATSATSIPISTSLPQPARAQAHNASPTTTTRRTQSSRNNHENARQPHYLPSQPSDPPTWDLLLHRIFLILQTAATGRVPKTQADLVEYLLHAACQLMSPTPPSLPQPLLELILWMYPEQLLQPHCPFPSSSSYNATEPCEGVASHEDDDNNDDNDQRKQPPRGNLPLHYAVQPHVQHHPHTGTTSFVPDGMAGSHDNTEVSLETTRQHICNEWQAWVQILLDNAPDSCRVLNREGRLPLHMALTITPGSSNKKRMAVGKHKMTLSEEGRLKVIRALVKLYPDSVDIRDAVTGLLPFQLAAASPHVTLDAVFYLLERSPDAILA